MTNGADLDNSPFEEREEPGKGLGPSPFNEAEYAAWFRQHQHLSDVDRGAIAAHIAAFPCALNFLIVLEISVGVSDVVLEQCLSSLQHQLLHTWTAIIVADRVSNQRLLKKAEDLRKALGKRLLILNEADAVALCEPTAADRNSFTVLLPVNYVLNSRFLYEIGVAAINAPRAVLFYTDEDVVSFGGQHREPQFKVGWNVERFACQDYLGPCLTIRSDVVSQIAGCLPQGTAANRMKITLEIAKRFGGEAIVQVAKPVLHRHMVTPVDLDEEEAAEVVQDWFGRGESDPVVTLLRSAPGVRRITWALPKQLPLVSIIIPTRDYSDLLSNCVGGLLEKTSYGNMEIVICDNDSRQPATLAYFRKISGDPRVRILPVPGEFNYSDINNRAVRDASGSVVLFLNNDIEIIHPDWLDEMVSHALRPKVGIVGAKLRYRDGRIQHAGVITGPKDDVWHPWRLSHPSDAGYLNALVATQTLSAVTGACLAMRRDVFLAVGGFNTADFKIAYNDVDLCLRVREAGLDVVWTPHAVLFHLESISRGQNSEARNMETAIRERSRFRNIWARSVAVDINLNPNTVMTWQDGLRLAHPRDAASWRAFIAENRSPKEADSNLLDSIQDRRQKATQFNADWYRGRYREIVDVDDALLHFMDFGCRERRDPNPYFSTSAYLERYADVRNDKIDAFSHYCNYGFGEGRDPFA